MPYLIDTHAHLCAKEYDSDREEVIQNAFDAGVKKIINVGASVEESRQAVALAQKYENVWAAVGIHPHECGDREEISAEKQIKEIEALAKEPKVVAVGEIGLDFAPPPPEETARDKQLQMHIFKHLIGVAMRLKLPLIIHSRDAAQETFDLPSECIHTYEKGRGKGKKKKNVKGVIHCFNYPWYWAEKFLKLGFHLSFTGIITYPNAKMAQETVTKAPLEKIMVETDCPFLAPQPVRGMRNEPKNVIMIAEKIAELKGISFEEVATTTTKNAEDLFGI